METKDTAHVSARSAGPWDRRRSPRVAVEIPLQLVAGGQGHLARTVLASREGVLVYSPKLFLRGSILDVRNPANGLSAKVQVVWSWVERTGSVKTIRLALTKVDPATRIWDYEYERQLQINGLRSRDRRRGPRLSVRLPLEVGAPGALRRAETFDVSDSGAGIVSEASYEPGTVLHVVRAGAEKAAEFRVVWVQPLAERPSEDDSRYRLGLEMLEGYAGFWGPRPGHA
jgi:hypothetical protein